MSNKTIDQADVFVTEDGTEIELLAIRVFEMQMVADALKRQYPIPATPTYEVETVGGGKELHVHSADTVTTPEEKAAWQQYEATKTDAENKINQAVNDYILSTGTRTNFVVDPNGSWTSIQRKFGVEIPTDPEDLRVHYLKTRVIGANDLGSLLNRIMSKTGIKQDLVETAKNSFRGSVRRQGRKVSGDIDAQEGGEVVHDIALHGDKDSEGVGLDA